MTKMEGGMKVGIASAAELTVAVNASRPNEGQLV